MYGGTMSTLNLRLSNGTESEQRTRDQVLALLEQYDLSRWLFCRDIQIDEHAGVNQCRRRDGGFEILLWARPRRSLGTLSIFLHEQLHVHLASHEAQVDAAVEELRALYPEVPVGLPEGARSERSTYEHLLLCRLEHDALEELVGVEIARGMKHLGYHWIYREVEANADTLHDINARHELNL